MAAASPVPSLNIATGGELRVIAYLRELRQEIQNLQEVLRKVKAASEMTAPEARALLVAECLESKARFDRNKDAIVRRLISIEQVFHENEALHAQYGDAIAEITNKWENAVAHWPTGTEEPARLAGRIREVDAELERIVYLCALLTVPERVNRNLDAMRVGQAMDFRIAFLEEISNSDHQRKLLDFLGQHPKLVHGLVDPEGGFIYRGSASQQRRALSLLLFLVFLLLPVPALFANGLLAGMGLPDLAAADLLKAYAAVAVGSIVHVAITMLKKSRSSQGGQGVLVTDWFLWVHVKETSITYGIMSLWVGLAGLVALGQTGMSTAFFVGYSLDSFVDLFLQRFETGATAAVETARAKLAGKIENS